VKRPIRTTLSGGLICVFRPPSDSTHLAGSILVRRTDPQRSHQRHNFMVQNGFKTPPRYQKRSKELGALAFLLFPLQTLLKSSEFVPVNRRSFRLSPALINGRTAS
jgi:hypothetical protein